MLSRDTSVLILESWLLVCALNKEGFCHFRKFKLYWEDNGVFQWDYAFYSLDGTKDFHDQECGFAAVL